jgi:hypothetical protein
MTTMLALMNGHHEHEVARLSLAGLLDILSRVLPPSLSFFISFFRVINHNTTTEER